MDAQRAQCVLCFVVLALAGCRAPPPAEPTPMTLTTRADLFKSSPSITGWSKCEGQKEAGIEESSGPPSWRTTSLAARGARLRPALRARAEPFPLISPQRFRRIHPRRTAGGNPARKQRKATDQCHRAT